MITVDYNSLNKMRIHRYILIWIDKYLFRECTADRVRGSKSWRAIKENDRMPLYCRMKASDTVY